LRLSLANLTTQTKKTHIMKRHVSLKDAHSILTTCSAVIWNDNFLCYPSVDDLSEDGNDEFMTLTSEDEEGLIYTASFIQNENERVRVAGSKLWLLDDTGEEVEITILNGDATVFNKFEAVE
jgi:hypothetical protein